MDESALYFSGDQGEADGGEDGPDAERCGKQLQPGAAEDPQSCQADELVGGLQ